MNIIKVSVKEIDELQRISIRTFEETFGKDNTKEDMEKYVNTKMNKDVLSKDVANLHKKYYILMDDTKYVGYIKLNFKGSVCKLERIYVLKSYQGKGLGQVLLNHAIEKAKKNNACLLELGVWEHNLNAITFYKKNKFKIVDKMEFVLGSDVQNDYVMQLKIGE